MKPRILFVCIENSCRSQIAEGFAKNFGKNKVEVFSAGSNPSGKVNPVAIEVMKEIGLDISQQYSKSFKELPYREFDYVITMGCGDVCPFVPAKERIEWDIPDPQGESIEKFREVRDQIKKILTEFLKNLP
jgi:glutathione/glutaredoxin type arsenate reductase